MFAKAVSIRHLQAGTRIAARCALVAIAALLFDLRPAAAAQKNPVTVPKAKAKPAAFASHKSGKQVAKQNSHRAPKVATLRPWELKKLSPANKLAYYRALQTLVATLEKATGEKKPGRHAWLDYFLPKAFALPQAGEDCLIGGYMSTWYAKPSGGLSCGAPPNDQIFDVEPGADGNKAFFCGDEGGVKKAYCNSTIFLYAEGGQRQCQPLNNFSQNCQAAFEARYGKPGSNGGDPHFPERLTQDFEKLSKTMDPKEMEQYYSDFDGFLTQLIDGNTFDAKTAGLIKQQIMVMKSAKAFVDSYPNGSNAPIAAPTEEAPAPATETPSSETPAVGVETPPADPGPDSSVAPALDVDPDLTVATQTDETTSALIASTNAAPAAAATGADSKVLGRELTCVRDGLKSLGYNPSERFLALVGVGVQSANGAYDTSQDNARQILQTRVISMVQSYGFCDEASYPSDKLKPNDLAQLRRWLSADGGKATPQISLGYVQQMMDVPSLTARTFYDVFGLRTATQEHPISADGKKKQLVDSFDQSVADGFAPFLQDEKAWSVLSLADRQKKILDFTTVKPMSEFEKCGLNAADLRSKDDAFRLQTLRPGPAGSDGKPAVPTDAQKADIAKVTQANRGICEAMAKSCGLETAKTCDTPQATGAPNGVTPNAAPANATTPAVLAPNGAVQ